MVYPCGLALDKVNLRPGLLRSYCSVAAQCPIPTHMAMHGDMGGKVCGWGGGETPGGEKKMSPDDGGLCIESN